MSKKRGTLVRGLNFPSGNSKTRILVLNDPGTWSKFTRLPVLAQNFGVAPKPTSSSRVPPKSVSPESWLPMMVPKQAGSIKYGLPTGPSASSFSSHQRVPRFAAFLMTEFRESHGRPPRACVPYKPAETMRFWNLSRIRPCVWVSRCRTETLPSSPKLTASMAPSPSSWWRMRMSPTENLPGPLRKSVPRKSSGKSMPSTK
mmetsp:Transcript_33961/g.107946  ORF Transcript_33961/g.107946 Transcript_33961/m.107946 type:complete len:201 (-) Transcript_33961:400-1002(-)